MKTGGMDIVLVFVLVAFMACVSVSEGKDHKVGDSVGWTVIGNPNYTAWAAANDFNVGDTIVFEYNKQFHNVMEVNRTDYRGCNPSSPRVTYTTGNDSVTLKRKGHYYFICGVPGHCSLGQKVDIRIPKLRSSSSSAPSPSPSPSNAPVLAPQGSHATAGCNRVGWTLAVVAMAAITGLILA